jgi:hypothetical protein
VIGIIDYTAKTIVTLWIWSVIAIWLVVGAALITGRLPAANGSLYERAVFQVAAAAWYLYAELRPFYLPAVAVMIGLELPHHHTFLNVFDDVGYIGWYWLARFPHNNDRWKRRRKRVTDRIKATVAGLVVVPERAST